MLDRPVHIQQYRKFNVVMSFVRLASTKASSLWRYIFMTKYDKTENCGIIFWGYAVVWKWRQGIKYLDMKAKTFWKFSKCVLFQRPTFNLEKGKITLAFGVETKDLWYPLLTDKHLQKGVQADSTKTGEGVIDIFVKLGILIFGNDVFFSEN